MPAFPRPGSRSTLRYAAPVGGTVDRKRVADLIERHWFLNRTAVNPDTDRLVSYLHDTLGGSVIEVPSGASLMTWRIPLRWHVRKAQLRRLDGRVVADYADNPLHLWTHSIPFSGRVGRDELLENHIQTDPGRPDEILYHYRNGYRNDVREWGFSLPWNVVKTLTDDAYHVEIDADLDESGTMKVVDVFLPGEIPETIFVMAHTCHPAQVADGIACVAAGAELMHRLKARERRRFSYRFLFGPEYFAALAWLSSAPPEAVRALHAGIYLDMVSTHETIGFQKSMQGNARIDRVVRNVLASHTEIFVERDYRMLWGNDENFYNGAGLGIPTVGFGRTMNQEYHYDTDNLDNYSAYQLDRAVWMLTRIVDVFEYDYVPVRQYVGPLYQSRYGIYVDINFDPDGANNLERIQVLMDGDNSCFDIADTLNLDYFYVKRLCDTMAEHGLILCHPRQPRPADKGSFTAMGGKRCG